MANNVTIKDADDVDRTIATKDVSNVHHQVFVPYERDRQDIFTVPANGTVLDVSLVPCSRFALQVSGTGAAPTAWSVVLEASLDNVNFSTILTHASLDGDANGATKWQALPAAVKYFRSRDVSITLGPATNIVVNILGQAA